MDKIDLLIIFSFLAGQETIVVGVTLEKPWVSGALAGLLAIVLFVAKHGAIL